MSALAVARRKLAELAAAKCPDERNEVNEVTPGPGPGAVAGSGETDPYFVNFVSFVEGPTPDRGPTPDPYFVNFVSFVGGLLPLVDEPALRDWPGTSFDGLSDRLLAALRSRAAAGDADSAREAVALRDYLAACDRSEVELPETPACVAAREWNAAVDELARQKAGPAEPTPPAGPAPHRRKGRPLIRPSPTAPAVSRVYSLPFPPR